MTAVAAETTRDRLVAAGMRLFAERGFRGTTVGDIEAAAGLTPRSGALYRHFPSKQAVLDAGLEQQIETMERTRDALVGLLPLGELRSELTLIARGALQLGAMARDVVRILEQDGDRLPELRERMRLQLFDEAFRYAGGLLQERLSRHGAHGWNVDALAAVMGSALVGYLRAQWTFGGATPLGIDEDTFVATLVDLLVGALEPSAG
ncbi:MAG: TetR/AcrR family transcriptional regulator, partial [Actinomycetota bacterium]